jgi:selenocysteine-specific elongation factor
VTTIGGGRVIGTGDVKLRRNRPEILSVLSARAAALDSPADWCELMLRESAGAMGLGPLAKAAQMPLERVRTIAQELVKAGQAVSLAGGKMLHSANLQRAGQAVATVLETFLSANPSRLGLVPADLAAQTGLDRKALEAALEGMVRAGQLVRQQEVIAPAGRKARVAPELDRAGQQVESALREGHLSPPDLAELAARLHLPAGRVEQALALLSDRGQVVRLDERVAMHREAVEAAKRVALRLFAKASGFSTMEFRDALGVSRKFAVPLLDYFDTIKLTVRQGNRRTPGAAARGLMKES